MSASSHDKLLVEQVELSCSSNCAGELMGRFQGSEGSNAYIKAAPEAVHVNLALAADCLSATATAQRASAAAGLTLQSRHLRIVQPCMLTASDLIAF